MFIQVVSSFAHKAVCGKTMQMLLDDMPHVQVLLLRLLSRLLLLLLLLTDVARRHAPRAAERCRWPPSRCAARDRGCSEAVGMEGKGREGERERGGGRKGGGEVEGEAEEERGGI